MYQLKKLLVRHIEKNLPKYTILLIVLGIGVVVGLIISKGFSDELSAELTEQISASIKIISVGDFDRPQIMKISFLKNIRMFIIIFLCGFSLWLFPLGFFSLFLYGFSIGFTLGTVPSCVGGIGFGISVVSMIFTFAVMVPIYIFASVVSLNNSLNIRSSKNNNARYFIVIMSLFILSTISVLFDSLLIPNFVQLICS